MQNTPKVSFSSLPLFYMGKIIEEHQGLKGAALAVLSLLFTVPASIALCTANMIKKTMKDCYKSAKKYAQKLLSKQKSDEQINSK